ncbi:MAG: NTP transferase domain-containing protein [Candidatus Ventricola sp.]
MARVGCVILAAGASQRFGGDKLMAPLLGKPVLSHVLDALPMEALARVICVVSSDGAQALCDARGVPCVRYGGGTKSDTLRLGLSGMLDMDGCLFVQGDQPLLRAESVRRLLDAFSQEPETACRLAWGDQGGSPVIFPRALFGELMALTGERGGASILRARPVRLQQAENSGELMDCDTPQALAHLAAQRGGPKK